MGDKDIFKKIIDKVSKNKRYTNLAMIISIGIMILIGMSVFTDDNSDKKVEDFIKSDKSSEQINYMENYSEKIESRLSNILSQMKGVGEVNVMVTLEETIERVPAINTITSKETTDEKDAQGGIRDVIREEYTEEVITSDNKNSLLILKEIKPEVKGVIIVAQGASNTKIKESIYNAVKTVLGISGNKVEVYIKN